MRVTVSIRLFDQLSLYKVVINSALAILLLWDQIIGIIQKCFNIGDIFFHSQLKAAVKSSSLSDHIFWHL